MAENTTTLTIGGQDYDVRLENDQLVVSRQDGDGELSESVPVDQLGDDARAALEQGKLDDSAFRIAVEGVARALADRGA
jgi:hypothetical protein